MIENIRKVDNFFLAVSYNYPYDYFYLREIAGDVWRASFYKYGWHD